MRNPIGVAAAAGPRLPRERDPQPDGARPRSCRSSCRPRSRSTGSWTWTSSCPAARPARTSSTPCSTTCCPDAPPTSPAPGSGAEGSRRMSQTITIDPVTRIEGHSKITIQLDDRGEVVDAHFHVTQFRGFERITQGRPVHEMPAIMARICGICPVSHLVASAKAVDDIMAVEPTPTGADLRRIINLGQIVQSQRPVVLPPLVARPAVRVRRRPGDPQHHRRRPQEPAARAGRHRAAQVGPADHRVAGRQAHPPRRASSRAASRSS